MIRRRVPIPCPRAHQALGSLRAYQETLQILSELPNLYKFDPCDTGVQALTGHMSTVLDLAEDAYSDLVVAVSVYCATELDIDVDSADNFRIVSLRDDLYAMLATRQRGELPVLESLCRPRRPRYPVPLDIVTCGGFS